ncbi:MAG TPA: AAA family ATPase [Streptosporangiaceae bacterium]|nr:AAA family ATPase [Streptosporangiaceae bacterium]
MRRYILTGAPGAGKTSILQILAARGYPVVAEAATDVIAAEQARGVAEPWQDPVFIDKIIELQRTRQLGQHRGGLRGSRALHPPPTTPGQHRGDQPGQVEFYDRSPVCTLALAKYVGFEPSKALSAELDRVIGDGIYQRQVFLIRPLGFIEPTAARRISYEDSLRFEQIHEAIYARLNFRLIDVNPDSPEARAAFICDQLTARAD